MAKSFFSPKHHRRTVEQPLKGIVTYDRSLMFENSYAIVLADDAHHIGYNSTVSAGIPRQALLKAYDEQNSSEVLPPTRKSKIIALLLEWLRSQNIQAIK